MQILWVLEDLLVFPRIDKHKYFKYAKHLFKHLQKSKRSQHAENCFQQARLPLHNFPVIYTACDEQVSRTQAASICG